jgi:hypothetical protein
VTMSQALAYVRAWIRRPRSHTYLSTGCRHGEHGYCQSHTGLSGAKKPSRCKFCGTHCICGCHKEARP